MCQPWGAVLGCYLMGFFINDVVRCVSQKTCMSSRWLLRISSHVWPMMTLQPKYSGTSNFGWLCRLHQSGSGDRTFTGGISRTCYLEGTTCRSWQGDAGRLKLDVNSQPEYFDVFLHMFPHAPEAGFRRVSTAFPICPEGVVNINLSPRSFWTADFIAPRGFKIAVRVWWPELWSACSTSWFLTECCCWYTNLSMVKQV